MRTTTNLSETKISAQNMKIAYKQQGKYKNKERIWTALQKIEMDGNCAFWKLIILNVFQISFVWFVMFDIMLGRHICLTQCKAVILSFTSNFSSFRANTSLRSRRLEVMSARKNGAREGDTRGERERLPERPMKIVFTRFLRVRKVPIVPILENNI